MSTDNATYLFQRPDEKFHNCEGWWSAYFSMILLSKASGKNTIEIPVYESNKRFPSIKTGAHGKLKLEGLSYENVVVDGPLTGNIFGVKEFPIDCAYLRPDVSILFREKKQITFIEVKMIRGRIESQLDKYSKAVEYLRTNGWTAELYCLLSHGYTPNSEWVVLEEKKANIILWEDVLKMVLNTPLECVFSGKNISIYLDHNFLTNDREDSCNPSINTTDIKP